MTLWNLTQGQSAAISHFGENLSETYRTRLTELGFHPGETISCMLATKLGAPKLYLVNNAVYSLDNIIASQIGLLIND